MAAALARFWFRSGGQGPRAARLGTAAALASAGTFAVGGHTLRCDDGPAAKPRTGDGGVPVQARPCLGPVEAGQQDRSRLIFGVPKKGRLYEQIKKMLEGAGIDYTRRERIDIAHCHNLPVSIVFLPAKDIATYVGEGDVDIGITGEDVVAESDVEVKVLMQLGIGKCNLSVQAPKDAGFADPQQLAGRRIVTSFPNITEKYFRELEQPGKPTHIRNVSGSVEAACGLGLADGIVDLVETGTTMRAAGLEEVSVVMKSQAVLIMNPHSTHPELCEVIRRRLAGHLTAQRWVMVSYNVHRFNLKAAEGITPGKTSPSVQPLEDKNWVAVAALVEKSRAAEVMDQLEVVGAKEILLTSFLHLRHGQ